jgi:alkylation response protein AidB-like acyl-CoA dehydrogenase
MAYELPDELIALKESADAFASREIAPRVEEAESTETFPKDLYRKAGQSGCIGMRYPSGLGGQGTGIVAEVLWREARNHQCAGSGWAVSVHGNSGA